MEDDNLQQFNEDVTELLEFITEKFPNGCVAIRSLDCEKYCPACEGMDNEYDINLKNRTCTLLCTLVKKV